MNSQPYVGRDRTYIIDAVEVDWDYAPQNRFCNQRSDSSFFLKKYEASQKRVLRSSVQRGGVGVFGQRTLSW